MTHRDGRSELPHLLLQLDMGRFEPAEHVLLDFHPSRSEIVSVAFTADGQPLRTYEGGRNASWAALVCGRPARIVATIAYRGDMPRVAHSLALQTKEEVSQHLLSSPIHNEKKWWQRVFDARKEFIELYTNEEARSLHRFFYEIDIRTHPGYLKATGQLPDVDGCFKAFSTKLNWCLIDRADIAWNGRPISDLHELYAPTGHNDAVFAGANHWEGVLHCAFTSGAIGTPDDPAYWQRFRLAFQRFVSGDLRIGIPWPVRDSSHSNVASHRVDVHGGPNSSAYLLFAEAAAWFARHADDGPRREFWEAAFKVLADTAEVFCWLYWSGQRRDSSHYGPPFAQGRAYSLSDWSRRRDTSSWSFARAEERFSDTVCNALVDERPTTRADCSHSERRQVFERKITQESFGDLSADTAPILTFEAIRK